MNALAINTNTYEKTTSSKGISSYSPWLMMLRLKLNITTEESENVLLYEVNFLDSELTQMAMEISELSLAEEWDSEEDKHWESFL